ncbi:Hypothetical predicted protein, partial [Pelobates cultripes]
HGPERTQIVYAPAKPEKNQRLTDLDKPIQPENHTAEQGGNGTDRLKIRCKVRVILVATPPMESGTTDPANMGRRSQRAATGGGTNAKDISSMPQRPAEPKMAAISEQDTSSAGLEQPSGVLTDPQSHMDVQPDPDALIPATKLDIRNLLAELKQMSAVDMALLRTEVQAVTDRVQTTEEAILDVQHEMRGLKETVMQLQTAHSALLNKLDAAEDRNRRNNVEIRGIPITTTLPQTPHRQRS